ncbi:uncharacterized protein LOC132902567 [Amyelois transitella]|uniref:uncharacterized protein LOC132902567 n=1 Tax=Amyelois transitella TaxID=680683 RepID=UPI00298FFB51|nr:uncharacterized protein LOC132902567 [Amyelois transitella]
MPPKKDVKDNMEEHESRDDSPKISFRDIEQSMTTFSGDDTYPISTWFDEFEDVAQLMDWSETEKLIYAKRLLTGTAKLFLRSLGSVRDYKNLKQQLDEEFGAKLNSAAIHKKLSSRKMKKDETYQQYFLHMKECALHGNIEDAALMEYVIDGIEDTETNKAILYGASNLKEFRKKLDIYKTMKEKCQNQSSPLSTQPMKNKTMKRCFKCGDLDHQAPACTKGIKCFRCNEFGHKGTECNDSPKKVLNIQNGKTNIKIDEEDKEVKIPYKRIRVNNFEKIALIDTGSDVNLMRISEVMKVIKDESNYDKDTITELTGIAGKRLHTEGLLSAKVVIDDYYTDFKFYVVQDNCIPVSIILGNPLLKEFEVKFTAKGVYLEKNPCMTRIVKENHAIYKDHNPENKAIAKKINKIFEEYKNAEKKKESNIDIKLVLTDEDPIRQSPRPLPPLERTLHKKDLLVARWASLLEEYSNEIELNNADALIRNPVCTMHTKIAARQKKVPNAHFGTTKIEEPVNRDS